MRRLLVLCLAFGAAGAFAAHAAADADDATRIDVAVGETVARDVGIAVGLRCDDLGIVRVALRTASPASNVFEVTGVTPGTTRCRVGIAQYRPSYLFDIHVVPAATQR